MRRAMRVGVVVLALAGVVALGGAGRRVSASAMGMQVPAATGKGMPSAGTITDPMPTMPDPERGRQEAIREKLATDERHKRLISDTDKLLQLATELKMEVDKAGKNELSLKVIQKATEIEKLSRDVKERMRN